MMKATARHAILAVALSLAVAAPAGARRPQEDALTAFEAFVRQRIKQEQIPALTIGFVRDDAMWVRAFGYADLENEVPATADSAYRLASVQKSMTAVAVLQLAERGKIDLDAEIQTYVPYFPRKRYPVTVRQLLGHLGGIPHYVNRDVEQHITVHKTTREAIAIFESYDLVAEPGTAFSYSTYGYNLLGAAIESASGQSYGDYMRDHVWGPAGMTATRLDDPVDLIPNRVRGYRLLDGKVKNSEFVDISSRFAGGGTRGTVGDLLKFMRALNEGRLLSARSLELLYTPMRTRDGKRSGFPRTEGYAMGWNVMRQRGGLVFTNDGGQQETRTFILNVPSRRISIAIAMNLEADVATDVLFRFYEIVTGEPFELGAE